MPCVNKRPAAFCWRKENIIERKYPNLCSPIQLGNTVFRNRMFCAPTAHKAISPEGYALDPMIENFEIRARGGAANITVSEAIVHRKTGIRPAMGEAFTAGQFLEVEDVRAIPGLAATARAISRHGAVPSMELNHPGKRGIYRAPDGREIHYGASEGFLSDGITPIEEMPVEIIKEIIQSYGTAAANLKRAGFGMLFIHGGHGWLLHQFFSPAMNHRRDEYGGSLENRARFMLEVLDTVRKAVGPGFPIELRISADEDIPGGYKIGDAIELAKLVENRVDLLHVSTGVHSEEPDERWQPDGFKPRGVNVHYAAEIKKHVSVPVATVGALNDPEMMEEIIASGKADVVEMARALIADPELPNKVMAGREDEIVHCLRCFVCLNDRFKTGISVCSLNPQYSREHEALNFAPAAVSKRVLVVGGGPGGMEAALTAARRGHKVTLCEKRGQLGGAMLCEKSSFKEDMIKDAAAMAKMCERAGVDIRLNTEVTKEYAEKEAPDAVLVAAGAVPFVPPIPGIDNPRVILSEDLSERFDEVGKRVVMLGGGQVGCEFALHLAMEGHEVTVVEMLDELAADAGPRRVRPLLLKKMEEYGIRTETGTRASRVADDGLYAVGPDGKEVFFPADTVVCAAGRRPAKDVVEELRDAAPMVRFFGDCVTAGRLVETTANGYSAALDV